MELYGFGESGNAFKVAFALRAMEIDWRLREVDFFGGETRGDAFRALNPMGEVPVLVDGDTVLTQSGVILDYLASKTGRFAGRSAAERREVLRWLFWDNHKFTGQIATLRFLTAFLPEEKRPEGVVPFLQGRVTAACKVLDTHLSGREWLVGAAPTVADLSLCGYLWYPEPHGVERAQWPGIDAWLDRLAALPGWAHPYDLMPRNFPGADAKTK
jgi:glutathione S-transferase